MDNIFDDDYKLTNEQKKKINELKKMMTICAIKIKKNRKKIEK